MKSNKRFPLKRLLQIYLIIFSISILFIMWFFYILFLNKSYESFKTKEIKKAALEIKKQYNETSDIKDISDKMLLEKGIWIEIISNKNNISSNKSNKNHITLEKIEKYKKKLKENNNKDYIFIQENSITKRKNIIYSFIAEDGTYFFLATSVKPIDSTVTILKNQFVIVSIITLFLSFGSSLFLAKKFSAPLTSLNETAKKVASGKYDETFTADGAISEISELADTLNYAKKELAKTENLRRDLLANVSHDLKTPLTMIKAYAEMIKDITYKDKKKREENLKVIIDEVDRLNNLVEDILDLSVIQSNIYERKDETFDIVYLTKNILDRYKIFAMTEDYNFIFETNKETINITADKNKLEQALYNLINNAINYTGNDKSVTVRINEENKYIKVEVIDTGKGIKKEDIDKIWEKYYKNEKKHKRNMIGTGLGLSIVKNIFELHNYRYGVKSKKNEGTNFYFEIPINNKKKK